MTTWVQVSGCPSLCGPPRDVACVRIRLHVYRHPSVSTYLAIYLDLSVVKKQWPSSVSSPCRLCQRPSTKNLSREVPLFSGHPLGCLCLCFFILLLHHNWSPEASCSSTSRDHSPCRARLPLSFLSSLN